MAAGDIVQKILWPSMRQPASVRTARVDGRGEDGAFARDLVESPGERADAALVAGSNRDLPATHDVQHVDEVHVHPEGQRRVAAGEPARRDDHVVRRRDAEAALLLRERGGEEAALLHGGEAVEGEAAVAVVRGSLRGDLVCERLRESDEAHSGFRSGC